MHHTWPLQQRDSTLHDTHWIRRLTPFGEQYYRENWARYQELYPGVEAPAPDVPTT